MYPVIKFQLTWRTSDFETKFGPKNMSEKKKKKKLKRTLGSNIWTNACILRIRYYDTVFSGVFSCFCF